MRMFYAVNFEDYIKEELAKNLAEIKKHASRGNFTEKENFHITLLFVGETAPDTLKELKKAADNTVAKLKPSPIEAKIENLGTFARPGDELLWAGVKTNPENILAAINRTLAEELEKSGIVLQKENKFSPHITLARKVEFYEGSKSAMAQIKFAPVDFAVNAITLMESVQETKIYGGRRYSQIAYKPIYETKF